MVVGRLFLAVPQGCLRFVIVVFPDHSHLLFLKFEALFFRILNTNTLLTNSQYLTLKRHGNFVPMTLKLQCSLKAKEDLSIVFMLKVRFRTF